MDLKKSLDAAASWLLDSGVQNLSGEEQHFGSFADWYDLGAHRYHAAYPEITGYGIKALLFLERNGYGNGAAQRGIHAARWLTDVASLKTRGGFVDKVHLAGAGKGKVAYTFDAGMILNGLAMLNSSKKDAMALELSIKTADWLLGEMEGAGGGIYPYEPRGTSLKIKWSTQSGSFHSKLAIGFNQLAAATGKAQYSKAADVLCKFALSKQQENGRFITDHTDQSTYTHAHCYSTEGLFYYGITENNEKCLDAALRAAEWLRGMQLEDGGISRSFVNGKRTEDEGSDILSQALRIWKIASAAGNDDFKDECERGYSRLLELQMDDGDPHVNGGFIYGYDKGKRVENVNSWATMFALQALWLGIGNNAEKFDVGWII